MLEYFVGCQTLNFAFGIFGPKCHRDLLAHFDENTLLEIFLDQPIFLPTVPQKRFHIVRQFVLFEFLDSRYR